MLKYEQHKQKPLQRFACNLTYGQHRKNPPFSVPPEKTPRKEVEEAAEVEEVEVEEVEEVVEVEIPLLLQEDPLQAQITQVAGEERTDSSDNPWMYSQEIAPRRKSSSCSGNCTTTSITF